MLKGALSMIGMGDLDIFGIGSGFVNSAINFA